MTTFFGFAIADSMFPVRSAVCKLETSPGAIAVRASKDGFVSCCNPSHKATIDAMRNRFPELACVQIPASAPKVTLGLHDSIIVMSVRGLPRLGDGRSEYTSEEIAQASFEFSEWTVVSDNYGN